MAPSASPASAIVQSGNWRNKMLIHQQVLQEAKKRQGEVPRDLPSKAELLEQHMLAQSTISACSEFDIIVSLKPDAYPPCITPVAELNPIAIHELQLETHHRGSALILRVITHPLRFIAISVIGEDERGDGVFLGLFNQYDEETRPAADIIDKDTLVMVKEPYFTVTPWGDYIVRVDHLSDVLYLEDNNALVPARWRLKLIEIGTSASELHRAGNAAMSEGRYWEAIAQYCEALKKSPTAEEVVIIKRDRARAYLQTAQLDAALIDTGYPHFGTGLSEEALLRAAEALYRLQRFSECRDTLRLLCKNFANNARAITVLKRALARTIEQDSGRYDFGALQKEAKKLQKPHLDHATYVGPIEIRETPDKGRGVFVTESVKAGDLLLCEKAFAHAWVHEKEHEGRASTARLSVLADSERNIETTCGQTDLIKMIVHKLERNPSLAPAFTALYRGAYKAAPASFVDGKPIVDTFLVERTMSFNAIRCPRSSLTDCLNFEKGRPLDKFSAEYQTCGLWEKVSYFNHSCKANAFVSFIGDMLIVRATQDLKSKTEVTLWYVLPEVMTYEELRKKHKQWHFECDCAICQEAKDTSLVDQLKRIQIPPQLNHVIDTLKVASQVVEEVERAVMDIEETYRHPASDVPRLALLEPLHVLYQLYTQSNMYAKVLEVAGRILTALGFSLIGAETSSTPFQVKKWGLHYKQVMTYFVDMHIAFKAVCAFRDAVQALDYAKLAYKMRFGEDATFNDTVRDKLTRPDPWNTKSKSKQLGSAE